MYRRPRIIPCLLLTGQDMVKTIKFNNPRYLGDPVNAVKIFNNKGVDELCILDITASREGRGPNMGLLCDIATEAFMPLSYGGGITGIEQVRELFHNGYEKVVLNTAFIREPQIVRQAAEFAGSSSITVSIDAKRNIFGRYDCYISGGREKINATPAELAKKAEALGAGEILLNSISRDGMMEGYDLELVRSVTDAVSIPVIACGGAGGVNDLKTVLEQGRAQAAAAGSMFVYYGRNKAILINAPSELELTEAGIYEDD